MSYNPDDRIFRQQVEVARAYVGKGQALWAGVGAYRLDIREIVERVRTARTLGASGVVLFSHESLDPAELRRLRDEAFATATAGMGPAAVAAAPAASAPQ
jgi:dihydrodipicolinate synthase/N-acetylneuraminate lyase